MRRSAIAVLGLFVCAASANASAAPANDLPAPEAFGGGPVIELVTMGPGALVVEKFGHAAMCVRWPRGTMDPESGRPRHAICYNYGTTNFKAPLSLSWGFLRGNAAFWVERWPRGRMIRRYKAKDRSIYVQTFDASNMPAERRLQIAAKLEFDALEENRYYKYHHFHDNCTTRVRDILNDAVDDRLRQGTEARPGPTFREYGHMGFAEDQWLLTISDFTMGPEADAQPDGWQVMFLPRFLRAAVTEKLGVPAVVLHERRGPAFRQSAASPWSAPAWTMLIGLLIALPALLTRVLGRRERLGLGISGSLLGFIGALLWFTAIVSTLPELRWNAALLLFAPTDVALAFMSPRRRRRYVLGRVVLVAVATGLVASGVVSQPIWMAILFVWPTLLAAAIPVRQPKKTKAEASPLRPSE